MLTNQPIETYSDFWPYYLREHARPPDPRHPLCGHRARHRRRSLALIVTGNLWFALAALFGGYGFAWFAHFFVEKNRPATFTYPLWSLISDFRMAWDLATGALGPKNSPPRRHRRTPLTRN